MNLDAILATAQANVAGTAPAAAAPAAGSPPATPAALPASPSLDQLLAKPAAVPPAVAPSAQPVASPALVTLAQLPPDPLGAILAGNAAPPGVVLPAVLPAQPVSSQPRAPAGELVLDPGSPVPGRVDWVSQPVSSGRPLGRDGDGEPLIGTLFLNCRPDGEPGIVDGTTIVAAAIRDLADGGCQDFRTVDYGKGKGLLAVAVARRLKPADRVFLYTDTDSEHTAADVFVAAAGAVVRGRK